jgi:membrane-associated protease RseP (regulator of RpoE activity)
MKTNDDNNKFHTGIGPVTDRLLNNIIERLSSHDFKEILTDKIVDPVTEVINKKIQPYVHISIALYSILVILLVIIIYLLLKKNKSCFNISPE